MKEKKKIILRLVGGVGNQLFIYAFYLFLKKKNKYNVKLDKISGYQNFLYGNKFNQDFALKNLKKENFIHSNDCFLGISGKIKRFLVKNFILFRKFFNIDYITESRFLDNTNCLDASNFNKVYIDGYFQNIKYIQKNEKNIRSLIKNLKLKKKFIKSKTLCILFSNYNYQSENEKNYFLSKLKKFIASSKFEKFVIFSLNKPDKLINFLDKKKTTFIKPNSKKNALKNLSLISSFKYYFIDNSSYHWWGAWFSKKEKKIVFIPRKNSNLLFYKSCKYY